MKLIIEDDEGRKTVIPLVRDEISIGRHESSTIRLTERNVSRRHARILKKNGHVLIEDIGSRYGVKVNGDRIDHQTVLFDGDHVQIGDYGLSVEGVPRPRATETMPALTRERMDEAQRAAEESTPIGAPADAGKVIPPERMPHLMGLAGAVWGEELPLSRTIMTFGRWPDANDLVIDHPTVARTHGKLKFEGGAWRIYDHQSEEGTRVNGRLVTVATVQPGDTIEIGAVSFRFCAPGDDFKPPRVGLVSAAGDTQVIRIRRPKRGLYIGLTVAVLVVVGVAVAWQFAGGERVAPVAEPRGLCEKADAALTARQWPEAVKALEEAQKLQMPCAFTVETALKNARTNHTSKGHLEQAEAQLQSGAFRAALHSLSLVSSESVYSDAAKAKSSEAKLAAVKQLSLDVQTALDGSDTAAATRALNELQSIDPDAPTLAFLQKQLAEKTAGKPEKKEEKPLEAGPSPKPAALESPTPAPKVVKMEEKKPEEKKPEPSSAPADRDQVAQVAIQEGIALMSQGDLKSGIEKLKFAIAQKPRSDLIALAHKNIGVGYAKAHQPEEAISHLKIYLRLKPDAPDREVIERLVQQAEQK
jgi:pSer/pThr/pTyr-binding forkhead associated (FHA) protein/tetratricopeptide (TPR) repeat protein